MSHTFKVWDTFNEKTYISENVCIFAIIMSSAQIQDLIIQNSKGLPEEILQEILDFIQFLKLKKSVVNKDSIKSSLSNLSNSETKHLEDEFADYKLLYPIEK